jgi:hypothetical protein
MVTTEQGNGVDFCCNAPNQCCDSHTSRLAAVEALYFAKTGDESYREAAFRSYNWVTYFQGLPEGAHAPFGSQWWFTDEFADGPRRLMDAFWAVPDWAPADESHLLGASSIVTRIHYEQGSVTYSTFDKESTDVLRLDFVPKRVLAGGKLLLRRHDLGAPGYTFEESTRVLRIRHDDAEGVVIQGAGGERPLDYITFDDPHLVAGAVLKGEYPAGLLEWPDGQWKIGVPHGKFGTFNLAHADSKTESAQFRFHSPAVFAGIDVYNGGKTEALVTIRTKGIGKTPFPVKPGELRRLRTGWHQPASSIVFDFKSGEGLRFDNLAYIRK